MSKGICVAVTGPAATGKSTAVEWLLERIPGSVRLVTTTTRNPRPREVEGVDYHFLPREEFERRAGGGEFLEFEENYGNLYGSSRIVLDRMLQAHPVVFAVLDVRGARTFKIAMPETLVVFLSSPLDQIRGRLEKRAERKGSDAGDIKKRLAEIGREMALAETFDHVIESRDTEMETVVCPAILDIIRPRIL